MAKATKKAATVAKAGAEPATKAATRPPRASVPAVQAGPKLPPLEEGRQRFYVDLMDRHAEWLVRYTALLAVEKRRPLKPADAIEHILRQTHAIDPTKAGLYLNSKTVPAGKE